MININQTNLPKKYNNFEDEEECLKKQLDQNDVIFVTKLYNLKNSLCSEHLNIKSISDQIKNLSDFNNTQNFNYLNTLLYPEKSRGTKIPSQIPVPSCSFQLRNSLTVSPNNRGTCAFMFNPFFLASNSIEGKQLYATDTIAYLAGPVVSTFWFNNTSSANDQLTPNAWRPLDIGQVLPPVYEQYRLVSASLQVKYIGRLDQVSGIMGCAVVYQESPIIGAYVQPAASSQPYDPTRATEATLNDSLEKYTNFEYARDSFYYQENSCLEGIRALYFPIDNSYEEYVRVCDGNEIVSTPATLQSTLTLKLNESYFKSGFNWFFYAMNAPPNTNCFKVDIFCNFECLPNAQFLNYMPISLNPCYITSEEKKKIIMLIQNKPIFKLSENGNCEIRPEIFNKMIKKFHNGLPSLDRLKTWGIINALPSLSSGLSLAGNMIMDNMMLDNCY